jgi:hypothetical protein
MRPTIYLAGPIEEYLTDNPDDLQQAKGWRETMAARLAFHGISCLDPMRGAFVQLEQTAPMMTDKAIMGRDCHDCAAASLMIANFLGSKRASIGTSMECMLRYLQHKNTLAIVEPHGNIHDHAMLRETWTYRVATIESAVEIALWMLRPYR